jgi:hypothetical protein
MAIPDLAQFLSPPDPQGVGAAPQGRAPSPGIPDLAQFLSPPDPQGIPADLNERPRPQESTKGRFDNFVSGASSGTDQLQMSLFGVGRLIGREFDLPDLEDFSERGINRNIAEAELATPDIASYRDIDNFDDLTKWIASSLGNAVPSMSLAIGTGGVGGLIAKRAITNSIQRSLQKRMVQSLIRKGVPEKMAVRAVTRSMQRDSTLEIVKRGMTDGVENTALIRSGLTRGAAVGAFAGSAAPQTGEADIALVNAGYGKGFTAVLAGAAGGVLEALPTLRLMDKMFPGVQKAVSAGFVKDFAKGVGMQAMLEGGTEGAQQVIQLAAVAYHDPSFDFMDPDNALQVLDAIAAGAVVGAFTGGFGEVSTALQNRPDAPASADLGVDFKMVLDEAPLPDSPDGTPADNTLYEEIQTRVNTAVRSAVEPALNTIRDTIKSGADAVGAAIPAMAGEANRLVAGVKGAHEEFLAGHQTVIEDIQRYAKEQVAFIYEESTKLTGQARESFIADSLAELNTEVQEAATELKKRADGVVENVGAKIFGEGGYYNTLTDSAELEADDMRQFLRGDTAPGTGNASETETEFVFGQTVFRTDEVGTRTKHITRDTQAKPYKERSSAVGLLERLRIRFPSATESTFGIREVEGGFVVALEDSGQAEALREDEIVAEGIGAARVSARGSDDDSRHVKIKTRDTPSGAEGTIIDVPTLAIQGRKLGAGDNQTMEQGLNAMLAVLIDRNIIDDVAANKVLAAFKKQYPGKAAQKAISEELKINNRIRTLRKRLKDMRALPQSELDKDSVQAAMKKWRDQLHRLEQNSTLDEDIAKTALNPTEEISEESRMQRPVNEVIDPETGELKRSRAGVVSIFEDGEGQGENTRSPTAPLDPGGQKDFNDALDTRGQPGQFPNRTGPDRTIVQRQEFEDTKPDEDDPLTQSDSKLETEDQQNAESVRQGKGRRKSRQQDNRDRGGFLEKNKNRLKKAMASFPNSKDRTAEEQREFTQLRNALDILEGNQPETETARAQSARLHNEELANKAKEKEAAEAKKRGEAKRNAKKPILARVEGNEKVVVHLPGVNKIISTAVHEIVTRASKLLGKTTRLRIVNAAALQELATAGDQAAVQMLEYNKDNTGFAIMAMPSGVTYISTDNFADAGRSITGLLHEIGHAIHFDTWNQLDQKNQDRLWAAFKKDIKSGKRKTGKFINRTGESNDFANAQYNSMEFKEWMADQFVDWMNNRRAPRTAIEKFMEAVATKIDKMWAFIASNPGRFNQLNETFEQFADAVAKGIKNKDPTGNNPFFDNEGAAGKPIHVLRAGEARVTVPDGLTRREWNAVKERLENNYPVVVQRAKLISDFMRNAYQLALAPSTSVIRDLGQRVPSALKVVSFFNREEHGKAKKSSNYHQRVALMKGQFIEARYAQIMKGLEANAKDEARVSDKTEEQILEEKKAALLKELRDLDATDGTPSSPEAQELRALFDDAFDYMKKSGLPVGKLKNYFPRTFSKSKLIEDKTKILIRLKKGFMAGENGLNAAAAQKKARSFYNSLISSEADSAAALLEVQADELSMQTPAFANMRSRTANSKFFDQYLEDNLDGIVTNYLTSAIKRAEFNKGLGSEAALGLSGGDTLPKKAWNSRGKLDGILADAKREGATKEELLAIKNYVDANLGMYGRDSLARLAAGLGSKDPDIDGLRIRTAMASIVAYTNLRVLLFTVFASLPDVVGPGIRAGSMHQSFKSVVSNMRNIADTDSKLSEMARAFGIVSSTFNQHIMTEYVDNNHMPPKLRKWNEAFFKYTGLNLYTDVTRKMALAVGIDTLKQKAQDANRGDLNQKQRDRALQFLKEFDLTPLEVNTWVADGEAVFSSEANSTPLKTNEEKVAEALVQFVDESIMKPNPSQRPLLASHPGAMLIYHLKGFIYAMHDVVLKRMAHNFNIADTPAQTVAAIAPAILMLGLTALGLELRELVTRRPRSDGMDSWDYTWEIAERSGMLGIPQLGFDFNSASARGQAEVVALGGPAIGQLGDLISKPMSQTIPKAVPILSQLPWARDMLRGATPGS